MSASYGQFCPIAKASEIFATRWTPLIVRELMTGVHSFNDIHRGVPLISRAVLVARLRELEDHGVIERRPRGDGAGHEYWLTPAGEGLGVVMHALGQWLSRAIYAATARASRPADGTADTPRRTTRSYPALPKRFQPECRPSSPRRTEGVPRSLLASPRMRR